MDGFRVTIPPTFQPVTLAEAKLHCRVDISDDDSLITSLISAAREYVQAAVGVAICTQTMELALPCFPKSTRENPTARLDLPFPRVASVTSVRYYDVSGTLQTLDPGLYQVNATAMPGRIRPAPGGDWPDTQDDREAAVLVTYVAGQAEGQIDAILRQAVLLVVGYWYENRETVLVGSISKELEHTLTAIRWQLWDGRII